MLVDDLVKPSCRRCSPRLRPRTSFQASDLMRLVDEKSNIWQSWVMRFNAVYAARISKSSFIMVGEVETLESSQHVILWCVRWVFIRTSLTSITKIFLDVIKRYEEMKLFILLSHWYQSVIILEKQDLEQTRIIRQTLINCACIIHQEGSVVSWLNPIWWWPPEWLSCKSITDPASLGWDKTELVQEIYET